MAHCRLDFGRARGKRVPFTALLFVVVCVGASGCAGTSSATGGSDPGVAGAAPSSGADSGIDGISMGYAPCWSFATQAGPAQTKGGACAPVDQQSCSRTCGPLSAGFKFQTCVGGVYVEQTRCDFPDDLDASCFKIPLMLDASCPSTPPQADTQCNVPVCTVCNAGGNYLDSTGAEQIGYCICPAPGASGVSKWACATTVNWPCPGNQGC